MRDLLRVQQALNALVARNQGADQNSQHDCNSGQILDPAKSKRKPGARFLACKPKCDPQRNGRGRVAEIVNRIRQQRHAAGQKNNDQLQQCCDRKSHERPFDCPQPALVCGDRGINDPVAMAACTVVAVSMEIVTMVGAIVM